MPFIPAPGCARVEMHMLQETQQVENVWYVARTDTEWDETSLMALAAHFSDWYVNDYRSVLTSNIHLVDVKATSLESETAPTATYVGDSGVSGTLPNPLPNNVSFSVHKVCSGRGRSQQGRVYVPGISADNTVGPNSLDAGWVATLVSVLDDLRTGVNAMDVNYFLSVVSFFTDKLPRAFGVAFPILSFVARDLILDSQRRRLPGRGR